MTEQPAPHACKPDAGMYYCPTSGSTESDCHGGFDTCCDQPQLHVAPDPLAPFRALADQYARAAAASLRSAEASAIDAARLTRQAIAEGLTTAEYLLRATIDAADNSPATDGDDHA